MNPPTTIRLAALHTRYQFTEAIRVPIAVIGTTVFPTLSLLFFVIPQPFAQIPEEATGATLQLALFAVMSVCLFTYGVGVAQDRELPWDAYLRTLPAGPLPQLTGRLVNGLAFVVLGLIPLVLLAAVATAASLPLARLLPTAVALLIAGLPLFAIGITIGYAVSTKAALAIAQSLLLPLAFAGGLFIPPNMFPSWLDMISRWTPTRAGRDLVIAQAGGAGIPATALLVLIAWTVVLGSLAIWAYRRDEGRRFR